MHRAFLTRRMEGKSTENEDQSSFAMHAIYDIKKR